MENQALGFVLPKNMILNLIWPKIFKKQRKHLDKYIYKPQITWYPTQKLIKQLKTKEFLELGLEFTNLDSLMGKEHIS